MLTKDQRKIARVCGIGAVAGLTCDYCGQEIDHGKAVEYPVEVWEYDEYNSGMCFSRIETQTRCERCSR